MLTRAWDISDFRIGKGLAIRDFVDPHPCDAQQFVGFILLERHIVFGKTGHHAGAASGALVYVNRHAVSFGSMLCLRVRLC